jgi:HEAT repeat protein
VTLLSRVTLHILAACLAFSFVGLTACKTPAEKAEALVAELEDSSPERRREAALELAMIGKDAAIAVPALIQALDDTSWKVKNAAAHALKRVGDPQAIKALEQAVPYYVTALGHGNPDVRWHAAEGLGYFGECAKDALPALARAVNDPNEAVRNVAAFSFRKIKAQLPA